MEKKKKPNKPEGKNIGWIRNRSWFDAPSKKKKMVSCFDAAGREVHTERKWVKECSRSAEPTPAQTATVGINP